MPDVDDALRELIRLCLYDPAADREAILGGLPTDVREPVGLVRSSLERNWEGRAAGIHLQEHFELPHLRTRYPDEELNFCVPESYDPAASAGLLVLLHGGGIGSPREAARRWLALEGAGDHFGDVLLEMPFISVAPSNLLLETHQRWSNPQAEDYILAVVEEASYRYNVDPDRVSIHGQSMGGYGTYHLVQTIGDRFASVGAHAGAWFYGFWEGLRGVDFYITHGAEDARLGVRPRFTDVFFGRMASAILSGHHIPHTYREHEGQHSFTDPLARASCLEFFEYIGGRRREAFPPEVVTASRKGAFELYPSPHFFWLTIDETHFGTFELDHIQTTEAQPSYCTTDFRHRTIRCQGGTARARNDGDNTITIETDNVYGLTLWLGREMVDFVQPVRVVINGEVWHDDVVQPSLATALQSYARKRDPGMIFTAKLQFDLKKNDWEIVKQMAPIEPTG